MTDLLPAAPGGFPAPRPAQLPGSRNPCTVYLATRKSPTTRDTMKGCLTTLADLLGYGDDPEAVPWEHIRVEHTERLQVLLGQQANRDGMPWAPATVNKHLSALRGVLKQAWRMSLMSTDAYERASDIPGDTGTRLPPGRSIADAETAAMLRVCLGSDLAALRNAAIVAVMSATGIRRAEVASALRKDYDPGSRTLRVIGKGDKQREVYLNEDAAVYLGAWLARWTVRSGPLFCPIDRYGRPAHRHMTPTGIGFIIEGIRSAANLPRITAHDFRRTFIGNLLDEGVDLATAQELAGHARASTTAQYDRRPAATRRAAANRLRLPRPEQLRGEAL